MDFLGRRCSKCNFYKCNIHTFSFNDFNEQNFKCVCTLTDFIWRNKNKNAIELFIELLLLYINDKKENYYNIKQLIEKLIYTIFSEKDNLLIPSNEISLNIDSTKGNDKDIIKRNKIGNKEEFINDNYLAIKTIESWLNENLNSISLEYLNFILNKLNWYLQCFIFNFNELALKELSGRFFKYNINFIIISFLIIINFKFQRI
ncbi:hypothetical protein BCR36DRAFT_345567 [Piromyces finnis]|uniref:Uncharacterized protein n=1 Tax=Piromyces finnis TaxID=1754191 RepID=A0A1Y1VI64_9FUNG|nr:hypothetical protein BCR36DRAFT_345567 [Piromyces finnis]|eukprot:ORX56475.1 hypothetical protein BCR36DRAFT_345567 [Piromyces finnis]